MSIPNRALNNQFVAACGSGNLSLAQTLIANGANDFEDGMVAAGLHNQPPLVYLCVEHGANIWGALLTAACTSGSLVLFNYAVQKATAPSRSPVGNGLGVGYNYSENLVPACQSGNLEIVKELYPLTVTELASFSSLLAGLYGASQLGLLPIVQYVVTLVKFSTLELQHAQALAFDYGKTTVAQFLGTLL